MQQQITDTEIETWKWSVPLLEKPKLWVEAEDEVSKHLKYIGNVATQDVQ